MPNGLFNLKQQQRGLQQGAWTGQKTPAVNYLVVAGGGGSGGASGGGGGGGGLLQGNIPVVTGSAITVTVGAGGTAGSTTVAGSVGSNSVFGSIAATGGGGGGTSNGTGPAAGGSGGSGGGAASAGTNTSGTLGQGTSGQGNTGGGNGGTDASTYTVAGGGGGAGTIGLNAVRAANGPAGNGGAGVASDISGSRTAYAGGGGGGINSGTAGTGGAGGGASGGSGAVGTAGTANTGGGAGGGGGGANAGAAGGSGIVIISYPDTYAAATSTTGSPTVSTSGSGSLFVSSTYQSYVQYPANAAFAFGTGNFTYECWFYATATSGNCLINFGTPNSAGSFAVFFFSGTLYVRLDGTANDLTYVPSGITNAWHHIAVVRNGTTVTVYLDGVSVASGTRSNNLTQNQPQVGQADSGTGWPFNGYMSNIRIVKGTAVYTGAFTPSTTPLTAISGTSLLMNTVSPSVYNDASGNGFAPTVVGTTSWNALSPFTVTGYKNRVYTWTSSGSITF